MNNDVQIVHTLFDPWMPVCVVYRLILFAINVISVKGGFFFPQRAHGALIYITRYSP